MFANECSTSENTKINVESRDELFIPNSFAPESEKPENKTFKIYSNNILRANLSVYNRWGEKVYETNEPHIIGWDGLYKGNPAPSGLYYFQLELSYIDGRRIIKKGDISLLR